MPHEEPQGGQVEDLSGLDLADLDRAAGGDRVAFGRLVARHQARVFRLARALSRTEAAAEDALQETFLAAWRYAATFRGESSVKAWLLTIARNQVARAGRRRAGEPARMEAVESLEVLGRDAGWGDEAADPEARAAESERRAALHWALDRLSVQDREVIVLRDLEGLSGKEAADALGLPLAALKTRLHRARLKLLGALRRGGHHGP